MSPKRSFAINLLRNGARRIGAVISRHDSTFVSKHFTVDKNELDRVLSAMNSDIRQCHDGYQVRECNLCSKGNKSKSDNIWKLNVRKDGSYHCFRCSQSGSWFGLKRKVLLGNEPVASFAIESKLSDLGDDSQELSKNDGDVFVKNSRNKKTTLMDQNEAHLYSHRLFTIVGGDEKKIDLDEDCQAVLRYLIETRGLNRSILMRYGVGIGYQKFPEDIVDNSQSKQQQKSIEWVSKVCVTFPWVRDETYEEYSNRIKAEGRAAKVQASTSAEGSDESQNQLAGNDEKVSNNNDGFIRHKKTVVERIKFRALETKGLQRLIPKGGPWGLFGWHLVRSDHDTIIITEGEYDAMAVAQALQDVLGAPQNPLAANIGTSLPHPLRNVPVVSLPNGCSSLPVDILPRLERFKKVYLWLDNDKAGQDSAEKMAKKLGQARCYLVRPDPSMEAPPKDANDALRQLGPESIIKLLEEAKLIIHGKILTFQDIKSRVLQSLKNGNVLEGTPAHSFPSLTKICKGFRKGELVIFTGPTGAGKTTFLSQLSLDFARQGIPTLWGSFEIQNHRLVQKMLLQHYGTRLQQMLNSPNIDDFLLDFETMPLSFLNFHGGTDIDEIIELMDISLYRDDTAHIIIDNLQFMTPRVSNSTGLSKSSLERFEFQDYALDRFRKFASEKNVNVIVVIHPRKVDDNTPLHISSISGTAKATQEADMVLLLQKLNGKLYMEVKKNRFDGELGSVELGFVRNDCRYIEIQAENTNSQPIPQASTKNFHSRSAQKPVDNVLPL